MPYDINKDTPLIPYIIAERAAWNTIEKDERYKDLEGVKIAEMVQVISPTLVEKAEHIYKVNSGFKKQLNDRRRDCRYTLEMFMEHWTLAILKGYKRHKG